jgi:hypothetical protein
MRKTREKNETCSEKRKGKRDDGKNMQKQINDSRGNGPPHASRSLSKSGVFTEMKS